MLEQYIANDYARAAVILLGVFVLLRLLVFIIEKVIVKLTLKTKTDIDDILIKRSSKPITLVALMVGIRLALVELPLSESLELTFSRIIYSLIAVGVSYIAYVVLDVIAFRGWRKHAAKTKSKSDDSVIGLISGVLKAIWIVFTLIFILNYWGVEVGPFLAGLGIAGLAIAFALQSTLANFFGGVSIIMDKTVRIGDLVYLEDGTKGKILDIGFRSTRIKTFDNELVIVPNSKLAEGNVQNIALPEPKVRVVIPFGVAYGSDIEKVKKTVLKELKKVNGVLENPEPHVKFLEMADSSLNFKAYFNIVTFEERLSAVDQANTLIYNALNKAGFEIPFPQLDVNLKK